MTKDGIKKSVGRVGKQRKHIYAQIMRLMNIKAERARQRDEKDKNYGNKKINQIERRMKNVQMMDSKRKGEEEESMG